MQQYFAKNERLELEDSDYHHIKNVMRMKLGDKIKVVWNAKVYECQITGVSKNVTFEVTNTFDSKKEEVLVDVAFSLIKEQRLNYLLQKTTELGVNRLIPLNTKRSVVKIEKNKESSKIERWRRICKEASEQSFRCDVPKIDGVLTLQDLVCKDYDLKLLCSLDKSAKNIKKVLQKNNKCVKILLVVGPEGGFDPKEEEFLLKSGFIGVSLGDNVLRAETAPVALLSMINYEFMR